MVDNKIYINKTITENLAPVNIVKYHAVKSARNLKLKRMPCVSFHEKNMTVFNRKGAFVLLDFGKEVSGGVRFVVEALPETVLKSARFHVRLGESVTEATTPLGAKNAGNDHSPRDFEIEVPMLSDLTFGQSGFRFAYIELISEEPVRVRNIFATNILPAFEREATIETNDAQLNKILNTAAYTLKLCCQNGFIWDGIKRDRLVWSGDMHQEILTAFYLFGDNENIRNSIDFVREDTDPKDWVNWIPSYSAWWVINLCEYCQKSGNKKFMRKNSAFARKIFEKINQCVSENGEMILDETEMPFFLDWPTFETEDAVVGTAAVFILAAKLFSRFEANTNVDEIIRKLMPKLEKSQPVSKQAIAFKFLACDNADGISNRIEKDGAHGFSTFMAYYLLTADAMSGGKNMIAMIKEYFGAMIERGATTFWEDFDLDWLENSGRIDEFPAEGQRDIHGDFGKFCYLNFRHSLCHGWSSGVLAFFVEYIMGVKIENGKIVAIEPHLHGLKHIKAELPMGDSMMKIDITENGVKTEFDN